MNKIKTAVPKDWQEYFDELLKQPYDERIKICELSAQKDLRHKMKNHILLKDEYGREYAIETRSGAPGYRIHSYGYKFTRERHKFGHEYLKAVVNVK